MLIIKHERFIEIRKVYRDLTHFVFKMLCCSYSINQMFHLFSTDYELEIAGIRLILRIYYL